MRSRTLTEWAAMSEVLGNIAVVISLLVVAYTVAQNTTAIRAQIDNQWYDTQHANLSDHINDPSILALRMKNRNKDELSELEEERLSYIAFRDMIHWEQAFARHQNGLVEESQWLSIDKSYSTDTPQTVSEEWWIANKYSFRADFIEHVDGAYAKAGN